MRDERFEITNSQVLLYVLQTHNGGCSEYLALYKMCPKAVHRSTRPQNHWPRLQKWNLSAYCLSTVL